ILASCPQQSLSPESYYRDICPQFFCRFWIYFTFKIN
ncbi:TANGO6 isoform 5, partial [Pongo abelii]